MLTVTNRTTGITSNAGGIRAEQRPPIVLTTFDREKLFALLGDALTTIDSDIAHFLREEIERADIVPDDVPPNSFVRMGCEVKFIDHTDERIRRAMLVFPEEAQSNQCISILSSVGSALIGLGPGQSIRWAEQGTERSLSVLEVRARERNSRLSHRGHA
jgi:regulator of nucleoside diphosphate kinase